MRTEMRLRAYKTELDPTPQQRERLGRHAGACRFLYNLALERCQVGYKMGKASGRPFKRPTTFDLNKELTQLKHSEDWLYEISNAALQDCFRQLDAAYANFFRRLKEGKKGREAGFPKFKKRRDGYGSFHLRGSIHVYERSIKLPSQGTIKLKEKGYLPTAGCTVKSVTVSERNGRWYVSLQVEEIAYIPDHEGPTVGIDVGLTHLATLSDGTIYDNPKPLKRAEKKLRRASKALSRKQKGSKNRVKARKRLARAHERIGNIRRHHLHTMTTEITNRYSVVAVEDLAVANMLRNHTLARGIADASWSELRRQLAYKTAWRGGTLVVVPRFYPSTKQCSSCGHLKDMSLGERVYRCEECGLVLDRDLNAARNLEQYVAGKQSETENAPGAVVRPHLVVADGVEGGTHAQTGCGGSPT